MANSTILRDSLSDKLAVMVVLMAIQALVVRNRIRKLCLMAERAIYSGMFIL